MIKIIGVLTGFWILSSFPTITSNEISKNGMKMIWRHKEGRVHFTICAPTKGWLAVGFNSQSGTKGTYLIMGKVESDKVTVSEYYTISPGNYKPIKTFGDKNEVEGMVGIEKRNFTQLSFSLPVNTSSKYKRNLSKGKSYFLLLAFSVEDDFQHHSIMRTEVKIKL